MVGVWAGRRLGLGELALKGVVNGRVSVHAVRDGGDELSAAWRLCEISVRVGSSGREGVLRGGWARRGAETQRMAGPTAWGTRRGRKFAAVWPDMVG